MYDINNMRFQFNRNTKPKCCLLLYSGLWGSGSLAGQCFRILQTLKNQESGQSRLSRGSDRKQVKRTCEGSSRAREADLQRPEPPPAAGPLPSPLVPTPTSIPLPLATSPLRPRPTRSPRLGGGARAVPLQRTKTCGSPFFRVGGRFFAEGRIGGF